MHYGTIAQLAANPPCHIQVILEGEEETISHLEEFVVPGSDPEAQLDALMTYLRAQTPWNCRVEVARVKAGSNFRADTGAPAIHAAEKRRSPRSTAPAPTGSSRSGPAARSRSSPRC